MGLAGSRQGCHKRQYEVLAQDRIGKGQEAYLQSLSSLGLWIQRVVSVSTEASRNLQQTSQDQGLGVKSGYTWHITRSSLNDALM